ncbi:cell wall-binding repeat-containing protein [Rathayibacter sp. VKM Ac-2801]|uniref:cell wall-binding repeat-containing protein n=1 Tax=Rathayibacter sp. VKM Ac-2801 TaxID=2609255 RepID=UPI00131F6E20|nr:cell wall-binding repeat-containing protein [Rathayibacter sp. VKM Ac-2801]QHC69384.1 hypothetical protein GSU45_02610 [Rathayibacter sp. VKM Ac-2801]
MNPLELAFETAEFLRLSPRFGKPTMVPRSTPRRSLAVLASLALVVGALISAAPAAHATPSSVLDTVDLQVSLPIDGRSTPLGDQGLIADPLRPVRGADPAASSGATGTITIAGSITVPDGHGGVVPAGSPAVWVSVYGWSGQSIASNQGNEYSFTVPAAATYFVRATGYYADDAGTWYGGTPIDGRATAIKTSTANADITLLTASTVSGTITSPSSAASRFTIEAWMLEDGTESAWLMGRTETSTKRSGQYDIYGLPEGRYLLRAYESAQWNETPTLDDVFWTASTTADEATPLIVGTQDVVGVDLTPPPLNFKSTRIAGTDRYATAVAATRSRYSPGIPVLYVASGAKWADALSAGPAAAARNGALLLSDPDSLPDIVRDEILRLDPERVVVVGSALTVSDPVLARIRALVPDTRRIGGVDRYDTSRQIIADAFTPGSYANVFLATGANFPDALSAGPIAGRRGEPVLLVDGRADSIDAPTRTALERLNPEYTTVLGLEPSISSGFLRDLDASGISPSLGRLGGSNRYETSRMINAQFPASALSQQAFLASGEGFADALSGAAVAASLGSPVMLTRTSCVPPASADELSRQHLTTVILLGSKLTLSDDVADVRDC